MYISIVPVIACGPKGTMYVQIIFDWVGIVYSMFGHMGKLVCRETGEHANEYVQIQFSSL